MSTVAPAPSPRFTCVSSYRLLFSSSFTLLLLSSANLSVTLTHSLSETLSKIALILAPELQLFVCWSVEDSPKSVSRPVALVD